MGWKDFFYFSKGERRAFTLLLCIITIAFVLLILKDFYTPPPTEPAVTETKTIPIASDTTQTKQEEIEVKQPERAAARQTAPARKKYTPKPRFNKSASTFAQKYPKGTIVELNSADTTILKKVPGIGSTFANRIIKYRNLLGGYYSVAQLREVYGIDDEKYAQLAIWFEADTSAIQKRPINQLSFEALSRHPYLSYKQARVIIRMRERKGNLSGWEMFELVEEFTEPDKARLAPYFSFERNKNNK